MTRFKRPLAQKVFIHNYFNKLTYLAAHAIDTKYGHTKRMLKRKTHQIGYDFNIKSTDYLKTARQRKNDIVWLDYCCTPSMPFVIEDLTLCKTKWVFTTFSTRGCKWKQQVKYIGKRSSYKVAWTYEYNDTSNMIMVAYYKTTPPPTLVNPVGRFFKYKWKGKTYKRQCKKLLLGPSDEPNELYLEFGDSNEPWRQCKMCRM